jgi:hypothetical protein
MRFGPLPHDYTVNAFELLTMPAIARLEATVVSIATFQLMRLPELRRWRNGAATLIGMGGSLPGMLLVLGVLALAGGDSA